MTYFTCANFITDVINTLPKVGFVSRLILITDSISNSLASSSTSPHVTKICEVVN